MRIGVSIGQAGRLSTPAAMSSVARAAEQVGYASVWAADRLHRADAPRGGSGRPVALDPLVVLAMAATVTTRVRIGTGVLAGPWHQPDVLARSLATLDVLSEGRLVVGLDLGRGAERETLLLDRIGFAADRSPATPLGRRPSLLLAATTPHELGRVARRADGWIPVGVPAERLAPMWATLRDLAAGEGRDPDGLLLVPRVTAVLVDRPLGPDRPSYQGSLEQVAEDLAATGDAGASEVILGFAADLTLDEALDGYARLAEAIELIRL